jgi:hypothetical protein
MGFINQLITGGHHIAGGKKESGSLECGFFLGKFDVFFIM